MTTRRRSTRRRRCSRSTRTSRASSRPRPSASPRPRATCPTRTFKGKVAGHRSRHAEPDAQVRRGRHRRRVRAVEPRDLGYLAAYAAKALVDGDDHRQGRRHLQGRQAGRVHRRQGRNCPARRPVPVQHGATSRSSTSDVPGARPAASSPPAGHHPFPERSMTCNACASSSRSSPTGLDEYRERHAAVWPEMLAGARLHGLAQLLAVPARRRPPDRLLRDDRRCRSSGRDGTHGGQRPLAGRDGRVLRGPRRSAADKDFDVLQEVFHLEDQLARHAQSTTQTHHDTEMKK